MLALLHKAIPGLKKISSTIVLNASVLVQRNTESAQTTYATACTLGQILMLTKSHSHVHLGKFSSLTGK